MPPIRKGDGTPVEPKGISQIRTGDGRILFDGVAIPDSVVAHYDATVEESTGGITSITDLEGSYDLSGSATVISDGINGQQSFRFDGTDDRMRNQSISLSDEPFSIVFVCETQEGRPTDNALGWYWSNYDDFDVALQDEGDTFDTWRGGDSERNDTPDDDPHLFICELYDNDRYRLERDGSTILDNSLNAGDLNGFRLAEANDRYLEVDFGEIVLLENHTSDDLQSERERLSDKWSIDIN